MSSGDVLNTSLNLLSAALAYKNQKEANSIARDELEYNKDISENNLQFQKDTFAYQQALNQLQMEREDTSYSRTVSDMRLSGLSPFMMSGTNSAGSLSAGSAPQKQQVDATNLVNSVLSLASTFGQLGQVMSGIQRTDAETQYIKAQAESQILDNKFKSDTFDSRVSSSKYSSEAQYIDYRSKYHDYTLNSFYGLTSLMPDLMKQYIMASQGRYYTNSRTNGSSMTSSVYDDQGLRDFGQNLLDSYSYDTKLKKHQSEWATANDILSLLSQIFGFRK